jgi:hypothetical protein
MKQHHRTLGMRFLSLGIVTASLFICSPAMAWLMFEPFIGYNKGQEQGTLIQGIGLGARLGLDFKSVFMAVDFDYNDVQQGALTSVKYTNTGLTIGGANQRLRVWYGVISSSQFSYPSGTNTVTTKGSGSKIGLGTEIGNKLNLNLELRSINYTTNDPGTGVTTPITEVGTVGFMSLSWLL